MPKNRDEPSEEVPEVDKLAMSLILNIDNTPAVLATTHGLAINDDFTLRANNCEGNVVLVDMISVFVREAK